MSEFVAPVRPAMPAGKCGRDVVQFTDGAEFSNGDFGR